MRNVHTTNRTEAVGMHSIWSVSGQYHITGTRRLAAHRSIAALPPPSGDSDARPRCVVSHSACIVEIVVFGDSRMLWFKLEQGLRNTAMFRRTVRPLHHCRLSVPEHAKGSLLLFFVIRNAFPGAGYLLSSLQIVEALTR